MKKTFKIISLLALLAMTSASYGTLAADTDTGGTFGAMSSPNVKLDETPLMVIRFNAPHVAYARPLYETLSAALKAKPSAKFGIVSVAPHAHNPDNQQRYDEVAMDDTRKVLSVIRKMGMPDERILIAAAADDVKSAEVRIYLR